MKLRGRLTVAFLTVLIIPVILLIAAGGVILGYQVYSIHESYDVQSSSAEAIANPMKILNRVTRGVYNDIRLSALKTPERFEDMAYIEKLNDELRTKYSYIVLRKGRDYVYSGDDAALERVKEYLPEFGNYNTDLEGGFYTGGRDPILIKKQDFYFSDNQEGSIFVITNVSTMIPQIKYSGIQFAVAFLVIISFTAVLLTYWIYRSIVKPLNLLRAAANEMKNGNLDYSIHPETDDEIGMLCEDFEEMRKKLKELIEVRLQYEVDTRELISNISHDLKTPLTAIRGYAEGLLDGVADTPEKQEKYLKTIYNKAGDMTSLVEELSFYSKIDCDTIPYNFNHINIDRYFSDCIEELSLDLEVKNIDIGYFNYMDASLEVIADAEQLKRVINNIIGNSVKYMGRKKGIINIRIKDAGEHIQIEIEDNGRGIAKKDLKNIFDRFYRTDSSRNSLKGGSGLGLAIAKKVIEDHSGKIWASSKEGVGTSIYFTLKKYNPEKADGKDEKHE